MPNYTAANQAHRLRITKRVGRLLYAGRPISWINTAFPFGAAYLITTRTIDFKFLLGCLFFLIPYNVAMYGINDVFDYESDAKNPRKESLEGAVLAPQDHRFTLWGTAALNLPFLAWLLLLGNIAANITLLISFFAVIAYSAPVLRFKERPVLDSLTSSTHFVSPAIYGLFLADAKWDLNIWVIIIGYFLWGCAAHAFGAIQDIVPDRAAGISSVATVFGARATVRLVSVLWLSAGLVVAFTSWPGALAGLLVIPYLLLARPYLNIADENSAQTNLAWRRFIGLNYFTGFLVTLLLIWAW